MVLLNAVSLSFHFHVTCSFIRILFLALFHQEVQSGEKGRLSSPHLSLL